MQLTQHASLLLSFSLLKIAARVGRGVSSYMELGTDVRSEWPPFFRPGNISVGILFHPQIYMNLPTFYDRHV